jgi:hypothetical protein
MSPSDLTQALRECMAALDMCVNSSDLNAAIEEANRVLTKYKPLLQQLKD